MNDTTLLSIDEKLVENTNDKLEVYSDSIYQDLDSKGTLGEDIVNKYLTKSMEIMNSNLKTASQSQIKLENSHHKNHSQLEDCIKFLSEGHTESLKPTRTFKIMTPCITYGKESLI